MASRLLLALVVSSALAVSGCIEDLDDDEQESAGTNGVDSNSAPTISGAPPTQILEGELYVFTPTASDPDGDTLEFTISGKPSWATFNRATGRLAGTPAIEDVGNFTNIRISVSDGQDSTALVDFDISVDQIAAGQVTLSWLPPTEDVDGTPLSDLAGYRIYYGRSRDSLNQSIALNNPGLTRFVVENLVPAQWHFAMTSINSSGAESTRSAIVSKTIS